LSDCEAGCIGLPTPSAGQSAPPGTRLVSREFTSDPCCCFPGSHQFRRRLKSFRHETFAPLALTVEPLALTLEVSPVAGCHTFELGEFGFQPATGERPVAGRSMPWLNQTYSRGFKGSAVLTLADMQMRSPPLVGAGDRGRSPRACYENSARRFLHPATGAAAFVKQMCQNNRQ
jgi:hypothetical protein